MTNELDRRGGPSRRSILVSGAIAAVTLFVIGAVVNVPRIERDLGREVSTRLTAAGLEARVDFAGQHGTLRCANPLADPEHARRIAVSVHGVLSIAVDQSCTTGAGVSSATTTSASPPSTDSTPDSTVPAPSTSTTSTSTTSTVPAPTKLVFVQFVNGTLLLQGSVATEVQQARLRFVAAAVVDPTNVIDSSAIDSTSTVSDSDVATLSTLIGPMRASLVSGEVGRTDAGLYANGIVIDDASRAAFAAAASAAGIAAVLTTRPTATAAQASALADELNALVKATPILFRKGKATLDPSSTAPLQRVAGVAKRFAGLIIEVQGHTDSGGDPVQNQTLSVKRAQTVRAALIALGVPADDLTAKGFGSTQPVTDSNGNEIPDASRRVAFGVATR